MEPLDLAMLNKTAHVRYGAPIINSFTGRQIILPRCTKIWRIKKGPSLPKICDALADTLPRELSRRHGFKHKNAQISEKVPVEFTVDSQMGGRYESNFSVEAVICSVEMYPDPHALAWSFFGYYSTERIGDLNGCLLLKGYFRAISEVDSTPESLRGADYRECLIVYNPKESSSWIGEIPQTPELPKCGLIKDLDVLYSVTSKFVGGFMEQYAPDGDRNWGRLAGGNNGKWISCDATRLEKKDWEYGVEGNSRSLNLIGVHHCNEEKSYWDELVGDVFLCSDGTVLHSYNFSQKEWEKMRGVPTDFQGWNDGYYYNRFYPPGSPMIPKCITDSFEGEMPAWFYKEDEKRKVRIKQLAR